jgi:hypothetical protein
VLPLLTTDEFAQWFSAQSDRVAEDVAATLEVIARLGVEKEAPGSTEWLTWYEHPSLSEHLGLHARLKPIDDPAFTHWLHTWGVFNGYARRVVQHLESAPFRARLVALPAADVAAVMAAITLVKKATTRRVLAMSEYMLRHRVSLGLRTLTPEQQAGLSRLVELDEIRAAYLQALAAAGFEVVDVPAHTRALREIALRAPALPVPALRLLYGIDEPGERALVVLGEAMDRTRGFYGDSVRRAEQLWKQFLDGDTRATRPATAP